MYMQSTYVLYEAWLHIYYCQQSEKGELGVDLPNKATVVRHGEAQKALHT